MSANNATSSMIKLMRALLVHLLALQQQEAKEDMNKNQKRPSLLLDAGHGLLHHLYQVLLHLDPGEGPQLSMDGEQEILLSYKSTNTSI
jgi:hypothetical protein